MFVYKYKDAVFDLPDSDNNTFCVDKNKIAWVQGRGGGWTILVTWKELRMKTYTFFNNFINSTETSK